MRSMVEVLAQNALKILINLTAGFQSCWVNCKTLILECRRKL